MLQEPVLRPSVNNPNHQKLEREVKDYLTALGFLTHEATYHATMDKGLRTIISRRFTPTALYLRARADRMAIHPSKETEFEFECKTHDTKDRHDMLVEMLPIILHRRKSELGIRCLYCYRDIYNGYDKGFWIDEMPPIRFIGIPKANTTNHLWDWFAELAALHFPGVTAAHTRHRRGSGDPYIIVDESEIQKLSHWCDLILQTVEAG